MLYSSKGLDGRAKNERMLEWIKEVWLPYVGSNRALLSLDTFSGHPTQAVQMYL